MKLTDLAQRLDRIEKTSSRAALAELVAALLRDAAPDERRPLVYLIQGQLRPPFEGVELGLGEKSLAAAIARAFGASEAAVTRTYKRVGDLGLVAQTLAPARRRRTLTVLAAYRVLLDIARVSGSGSQQRKGDLMTALLNRASGPEAKVIARVAQGRLRLGIGDQTVLDGAALAALHDRGAKPLLEAAYNVRSDLGEVVHLAFTKGKRGLTSVTPEIGVPVRPALAQRLGSAEEIVARFGTVQAEPKYDGFRLQLHRDGNTVWTFSRRLENVTEMFPDLVESARTQIRSRRAIIEGEAVVYDPKTGHFSPFQVTMTRKRKRNITEHARERPLRLFAFDVLTVDGRSQLDRPQRERTARLAKLVRARTDGAIAVTETFVTSDTAELEGYFDEMLHRGLEGVVAKRLESPYRAGARGYDWVKLKRAYESKLRDTVDVVLVGYLRGRGKRAALGIGSLLAAAYDPTNDRFCSVAKIGSGLSDTAWKELRRKLDARSVRKQPANVDSAIQADVWTEPALVVEVLADEITRSPFHSCGKQGTEPGYALRFPRMVAGPRTDKAPRDATTVQEIMDMYRLQRAGSGKRAAGRGKRRA